MLDEEPATKKKKRAATAPADGLPSLLNPDLISLESLTEKESSFLLAVVYQSIRLECGRAFAFLSS